MVLGRETLDDILGTIGNGRQVFHREDSVGDFYRDISLAAFQMRGIKDELLQSVSLDTQSDKNLYDNAICEALFNALLWGNRRDPAKHISSSAFVGENGWAVQITDEGNGFDYARTDAEGIFHAFGAGFDTYRSKGIAVSFENGGRTVNIRGMYS